MLLRQTLLYLPAQLVGPIFQFVSVIAWTHVLNPREMGVFALISAGQELAYVATTFWFGLYTMRYYDRGDEAARTRFLDTESAVLLAAGAINLAGVLALPLLIEADWTASLVAAAVAYTVSRAAVTQLTDRARTEADTLTYSMLQTVWPVLGLAFGLVFVWLFGATAANVLWGYAAAQIVSLVAAASRLRIGMHPFSASRDMMRVGIKYGLPLVVGAVLVWVANNGIRFVVEWKEGAAGVGLVTVGWALGLRAAAVAAMLVTAAAFPLAVAKSRGEGGMAAGQAQLVANGVLLLMALAPAAAGLWAISEPVTRLLVAAPYQDMTIAVLPLSIAAGALRNFRLHFGEQVFLLYERTMVPLYNDAVDGVLTLAGAAAGLWLGGLAGAVAGAAAAALVSLAVTIACGWHFYRFAIPPMDVMRVGSASLIMVIAVKAMPLAPTVLGVSSAIAVGGLVYAAALALLYPEAARKVLEILRGFARIARG